LTGFGQDGVTRREALRTGAALTAGLTLASRVPTRASAAAAAALRPPGSLPDASRPAGAADPALPFDHVVVVMMENHSFDNYLGMLPRRGQPAADGFTFDGSGAPVNSNPYGSGYVQVTHRDTHCQASVSQNWKSTHAQIDHGAMDGFATNHLAQMAYWDKPDLPFYYSLANTFCVADRWFCSAPCQTYPNRRFLLAGTAFGLISTDTSSVTEDPPNGTIVDRLNAHGVSWRNYFTDVPATAVIASIPLRNPTHLAPIAAFALDCAAGTLPQVSFVDSDIGIAGEVAGPLGKIPAPFGRLASDPIGVQSETEENPADIALGESFVSRVVDAVVHSPLWPRILLVWLYDEHGGYYDHVPPPPAVAPDAIPPRLSATDPPGGYDMYGPRVPAVIVSGHARPHAVSSVVYDHTSVLATIEHKWNLPAMTWRDANAQTVADCLSDEVTFPEPPGLATPFDLLRSEQTCSTDQTRFTVHPYPPARSLAERLAIRFYGRRHADHGIRVRLAIDGGEPVKGLVVELRRGHRVVARADVPRVTSTPRRVVLRGTFPSGRYTLVVKRGKTVVRERRVRLPGR
jgi:phospholipase C